MERLMFGQQVRGIRGGAVRSMKDVGPYGLFSTVLLCPPIDPNKILSAFAYCVGQPLPGSPMDSEVGMKSGEPRALPRVTATKGHTNMNVAGRLVDEEMFATVLRWQIPQLSPALHQPKGRSFPNRVSYLEISEFVRYARITFWTGGEKPFYTLIPAAEEVKIIQPGSMAESTEPVDPPREDEAGSWAQEVKIEPALPLYRLQEFRVDVDWPFGVVPDLEGTMDLIFLLKCKRARGSC